MYLLNLLLNIFKDEWFVPESLPEGDISYLVSISPDTTLTFSPPLQEGVVLYVGSLGGVSGDSNRVMTFSSPFTILSGFEGSAVTLDTIEVSSGFEDIGNSGVLLFEGEISSLTISSPLNTPSPVDAQYFVVKSHCSFLQQSIMNVEVDFVSDALTIGFELVDTSPMIDAPELGVDFTMAVPNGVEGSIDVDSQTITLNEGQSKLSLVVSALSDDVPDFGEIIEIQLVSADSALVDVLSSKSRVVIKENRDWRIFISPDFSNGGNL